MRGEATGNGRISCDVTAIGVDGPGSGDDGAVCSVSDVSPVGAGAGESSQEVRVGEARRVRRPDAGLRESRYDVHHGEGLVDRGGELVDRNRPAWVAVVPCAYFLRVECLERRHHRHIERLHSVAAVRRKCYNHHPVLPSDVDDLEGDVEAVIVEYEFCSEAPMWLMKCVIALGNVSLSIQPESFARMSDPGGASGAQ